jgi:hypothetical protein
LYRNRLTARGKEPLQRSSKTAKDRSIERRTQEGLAAKKRKEGPANEIAKWNGRAHHDPHNPSPNRRFVVREMPLYGARNVCATALIWA